MNGPGSVYWDIDSDGLEEAVAWVSPSDGFLAIDKNSNGIIDNQSELFGNQSGSPNGFETLATYDTNNDGKITSEDAQWTQLLIWQDTNSDGQSTQSELHGLSSLGITEISLSWQTSDLVVAGNDIRQISEFKIVGDSTPHLIGDVWFKVDQMNSSSLGNNLNIDVDIISLPLLRGYGDLHNLTISTLSDNVGTGNLYSKVEAFNELSFADLFGSTGAVLNDVRQILYRWAGVENIAGGSRGQDVDAQELAFLEKLTGQPFLQNKVYSNPGPNAGEDLSQAFSIALNNIFARLAVEGAGKELFNGEAQYDSAIDNITGITGLNTFKLNSLQTEAANLANDGQRASFWSDVLRVIEYSVGVSNLSSADQSALSMAIQSGTSLTLSNLLNGLIPGFASNPITTTCCKVALMTTIITTIQATVTTRLLNTMVQTKLSSGAAFQLVILASQGPDNTTW